LLRRDGKGLIEHLFSCKDFGKYFGGLPLFWPKKMQFYPFSIFSTQTG